jgi:hypothetical protein
MFDLFKLKAFPGRVLISFLIVALVLFCIHISLKFISIVIFDEKNGLVFELSNRFDVNDENSVPQWFSQMIFLCIAASAALAGYLAHTAVIRRIWYAMALIGVVLSLDDVANLHEFALQAIHNALFFGRESSFFLSAWWIFLPIVLIPAAVLAWYGWRHLPRRTIALIVLGGVVYVVGKTVMDSLSNNISDLFLDRGVTQGLEKIFQYSGSSIVLFAVLDYLHAHHAKQIKSAMKRLRS